MYNMPVMKLVMLFCRVVDVLAVYSTSVAVTDDGCMFVCGRFDGEDITQMREVKAENARDLFTKGEHISTGGCAGLSKYVASKALHISVIF